MKFDKLGLIKPILRSLNERNYESATEIQEKAIPHVLNRKDLLACAQTGTGKTAAFALPIIQLIEKIDTNKNKKPVLRSLIVTPTRELAIQIGENIREYSKYTSVRHTVIFGGVKQSKQVNALKQGCHILVATPGRLLDLESQNIIDLSNIKIFVLDEADRMLDMGFIHDIKKLLRILPTKKQTLFFSATMPKNIMALASSILNNPINIAVKAISSTAETIQQYLYYTNKNTKLRLLLHILQNPEMKQVLLFCRTKHGADRVARDLRKNDISCQAIHGDKSQNQRQNALKAFKQGKITVLVATDIAARGIDIDKMQFVVNYNIPNESETYVHRIGRTGRAGESGVSISISEPEENAFVRDIEKLINQKIKRIDNHPFPQTEKPMTAAEKKEWNKEKQRRKQEFFANRKKSKSRNSRR